VFPRQDFFKSIKVSVTSKPKFAQGNFYFKKSFTTFNKQTLLHNAVNCVLNKIFLEIFMRFGLQNLQ